MARESRGRLKRESKDARALRLLESNERVPVILLEVGARTRQPDPQFISHSLEVDSDPAQQHIDPYSNKSKIDWRRSTGITRAQRPQYPFCINSPPPCSTTRTQPRKRDDSRTTPTHQRILPSPAALEHIKINPPMVVAHLSGLHRRLGGLEDADGSVVEGGWRGEGVSLNV